MSQVMAAPVGMPVQGGPQMAGTLSGNAKASWKARLMSLLRRELHPALARNRAAFARFDQNVPIEECSFVVVDAEMTGLDHRRDEVVSLGGVRVNGLSISPADTFQAVVKPREGIRGEATLLHRITPQQVLHSPQLESVLPEFLDWCGNSLVVGHHIGMDMRFLNTVTKRSMGGSIGSLCIDTMRLAQTWEREMWEKSFDPFMPHVSYTLTDLAIRYGLPRFREHEAVEDAMQTAYLFVYLTRKLRRGNVRTLKDLFMTGRSWGWYL